MDKKHYVILAVVVIVALFGVYTFTTTDGPSDPNNDTNNDDNLNGEEQLTAYDLFENHKNVIEGNQEYSSYIVQLSERPDGQASYVGTSSSLNNGVYRTYTESLGSGPMLHYANFNQENRVYHNIQALNINYYEEISEEEYRNQFVGVNALRDKQISENINLDYSEFSNVEVEFNRNYLDGAWSEYVTTEYTGDKYETLEANIIIGEDEAIMMAGIHVVGTDSEQGRITSDILVEYDYAGNVTIDDQLWTDNAVPREEAEVLVEERLSNFTYEEPPEGVNTDTSIP